MSIFSMFKSDAIKKTILKSFVEKAREAGITRGILEINTAEEISFTPFTDSQILVEKKDYEFYKDFFEANKQLLIK